MEGKQGLSLLLNFALAFVLMKSALIGSFAACDYCGPNYWDYYPTQSETEQAMWRSEIYYFMNYDNCDNVYPQAYRPISPSHNPGPAPIQAANNTTASYWMDNANRLYLAGYYDQAAASYAKALKLDPNQSSGRINMANSLYFLGRYRESLDAYNAVIASDPLNANAIIGKGKVQLAMNRTRDMNVSTKNV